MITEETTDSPPSGFGHYFSYGRVLVMFEHENSEVNGETLKTLSELVASFEKYISGNYLPEDYEVSQYLQADIVLLANQIEATTPQQIITVSQSKGAYTKSLIELVLFNDSNEIDKRDKNAYYEKMAARILDLSEFFYYSITSKETQGKASKLNLLTVGPNWLATAAPEHGGDGGPGGLPEPVLSINAFEFDLQSSSSDTQGSEQTDAQRKIKSALKNRRNHPAKVEIFVLDTVPRLDALSYALSNYKDHVALNTLFREDPRLTITYSTVLRSDPQFEYQTGKADYKMPDHGLFIAGTAAIFAPKAHIHLVEVMNSWGVCTLSSVIEGLRHVISHRCKDRITIVNCSFTFLLPLVEEHLSEKVGSVCELFFRKHAFDDHTNAQNHKSSVYQGDKENYQPIVVNPKVTDWLLAPLLEIQKELLGFDDKLTGKSVQGFRHMDELNNRLEKNEVPENEKQQLRSKIAAFGRELGRLESQGTIIFAAAGNDGSGNDSSHPPALFPATDSHVYGIGAIDEETQSHMADYSNIADTPAIDGFLTFGGLVGTDDAGKNKGMIGIYIHDFPKGTTINGDLTGWAYWRGTSFATGVMSGLFALLASQESPVDALQWLYNARDEGNLTNPEAAPAHEIRLKQKPANS